jgi:hypothetical protein
MGDSYGALHKLLYWNGIILSMQSIPFAFGATAPGVPAGDSYTFIGCDMIVSWNFKHIVNPDTIMGIRKIAAAGGLKDIIIYSPAKLIKDRLKMNNIPMPKISPDFTIEDIHKIREWNY